MVLTCITLVLAKKLVMYCTIPKGILFNGSVPDPIERLALGVSVLHDDS